MFRLNKISRAISVVLLITFIYQDIVWAYPDPIPARSSQNNKLAPQSFLKQEESPFRAVAKFIEYAIEKNGRITRGSIVIKGISAILGNHQKWLKDRGVNYEVSDNLSEALITFPTGQVLRYFDPRVASRVKPEYEVDGYEEIGILHKQVLKVKAGVPRRAEREIVRDRVARAREGRAYRDTLIKVSNLERAIVRSGEKRRRIERKYYRYYPGKQRTLREIDEVTSRRKGRIGTMLEQLAAMDWRAYVPADNAPNPERMKYIVLSTTEISFRLEAVLAIMREDLGFKSTLLERLEGISAGICNFVNDEHRAIFPREAFRGYAAALRSISRMGHPAGGEIVDYVPMGEPGSIGRNTRRALFLLYERLDAVIKESDKLEHHQAEFYLSDDAVDALGSSDKKEGVFRTPSSTNMAVINSTGTPDTVSDGDTTNPFILQHIDEDMAIEVGEKDEKIIRIRRDRSNPRDPPFEERFKSTGAFDKIRKAKDEALLSKLLAEHPLYRFQYLTAAEQEDARKKLIQMIQETPLSIILGHALIAEREDTDVISHVRTGFSKARHGLDPTIWIGEELFNRMSVEQLARLLVEEVQHILWPPKYLGGDRWINVDWQKLRYEDPRTTIRHDKDFIDELFELAYSADTEISSWPEKNAGPYPKNPYGREANIARTFSDLDAQYLNDISEELGDRTDPYHSKKQKELPARILLIGIGRGLEAFQLMHKYGNRVDITSTANEDLVYRTPEELMKNFSGHLTEEEAQAYIDRLRQRYLKCDLDKGIPAEDGYFDVVIIDEFTLGYVKDKYSAMREMLRVCREGGVVYCSPAEAIIIDDKVEYTFGEYFARLEHPDVDSLVMTDLGLPTRVQRTTDWLKITKRKGMVLPKLELLKSEPFSMSADGKAIDVPLWRTQYVPGKGAVTSKPATNMAKLKEGLSKPASAKPMTLDDAYSLLKEVGLAFDYDIDDSYAMAGEVLKHPIEKIMVAGSGLYMFSLLLALAGKEVVVVDLEPAQVAAMKRGVKVTMLELEKRGLEAEVNIKVVTGEMGELDLAANGLDPASFDLVTLIDLVGGCPQGSPRQWLLKARELLKPESSYILIDEHENSADDIIRHFTDVLPQHELLAGGKYFKGSYDGEFSKNRLYRVSKEKPVSPEMPQHEDEQELPSETVTGVSPEGTSPISPFFEMTRFNNIHGCPEDSARFLALSVRIYVADRMGNEFAGILSEFFNMLEREEIDEDQYDVLTGKIKAFIKAVRDIERPYYKEEMGPEDEEKAKGIVTGALRARAGHIKLFDELKREFESQVPGSRICSEEMARVYGSVVAYFDELQERAEKLDLVEKKSDAQDKPVSEAPHKSAPTNMVREKEASPAPAGQAKKRILVVDDEAMVLKTFEAMISSMGYDVTTASSAEEAFEIYTKSRFDMVITDLRMGGKSGAELALAVKAKDKNMPVILITGFASKNADLSGGDVVMHKPVKMQDMESQIKDLLAKYAAKAAEKKTYAELLAEFKTYLGSLRTIMQAEPPQAIPARQDSNENVLILYADSILQQGAIVDLEDTLRNTNRVKKLIIYSRDDRNGKILEDTIKSSNLSVETVSLRGVDIGQKVDEAEELRELVNYAKRSGIIGNGNGKLLGVVKGKTDEMWQAGLEKLVNAEKVPTVLFGSEEGVYSFREALSALVDIRDNGPKDGKWFKTLPRCGKITDSIYNDYRNSLAALIAA